MSEFRFDEFDQTNRQKSTYRPYGYNMSPGLIRARRRFFIPNLITGAALAAFSFGVWAYSISAVKQDVFDDIDEEARTLNAIPMQTDLANLDSPNPSSTVPFNQSEASPRGLVYRALNHRIPWLFDPTWGTIVWGAPPADSTGRIGDKQTKHKEE